MVISTVNQVVYNGDGVTTAFPFTFRIIEATDIKLLLIDADGAETDISADYYVDTVNNTVYYPGYAPGAEPPAEDQPPKVQTGQKLVVYRELPITQEKDLGEKWPFYVIELGLDKLTMILQQIFDWWGRTLKISQGGSVDGFDTNIYPEAGKVVAVNDAGNGFTSVTAMTEENNAWEGKGMQIKNIAGPSSVTDAVTKDYVDQILNGFVLAGDSRTVPFDTLAQLRVADIAAGQIAFTLGYYDINDGGAGVYNIRTATLSDVDDGGSIIILDNGNVAELIIGDTVNVHQFGAKGNANYHNYADGNDYESVDVSSATVAPYWDNVDAHNYANVELQKWYVSATFETEGTYLNPADGKHYVNYDSDTDTYTTEAPYHDNVADKWYVSATYSNLANARVGARWYYNAVFSTQAQDDTTYIQNAINSRVPVELLNGHTYLVVSLSVYHGFKLYGNGGEIKRPNFKNAPYNYTDAQIKQQRMFQIGYDVVGYNTKRLTIEFNNVTFNGNAFSMWNPLTDSLYKYEQGVLFYITGGNQTVPHMILFDNVLFRDNYASNITIQNNNEITITNCTSYNCFKGICTIVGSGNKVNIDNVNVGSDYTSFISFWYEKNENADNRQNSVNIDNCNLSGNLQLLTTRYSSVNFTNCYIDKVGSNTNFALPNNASSVCFINSMFTSDSNKTLDVRGYGHLYFGGCRFYNMGGILLKKSTANDYYLKLRINNCMFRNCVDGIISDATAGQWIVDVSNTTFSGLSGKATGTGGGIDGGNFSMLKLTNCLFDMVGYIYYGQGSASQKLPIFNGGNDVINAGNQGIYIYGSNKIYMNNEAWSVPVAISKYRSGNTYVPIGFGSRMTYVTEAPTFVGINDIDHAQLTVSPYTKYSYTNNAWVADT